MHMACTWHALGTRLACTWHAHGMQVVLVSAGFDAAAGDPLGEAAVTPAGFGRMTRALAYEAPRLLLALEGGYSLSQAVR